LEFILQGINSEYDDAGKHSLSYDEEDGTYIVPVYGIWVLVHEQLTDVSSSEGVLNWIVHSFNDGPIAPGLAIGWRILIAGRAPSAG
jgi:hypothetical protein